MKSRVITCWAMLLAALLIGSVSGQGAQEVTVKYQITGLFCKEREADLREVIGKIAGVKLVRIDFDNAEATFRYNPKQAFPSAKPEQVVEQFNNKVRSASNSTFGIRPLRTISREKLKLIEIKVAGCDCKACSLGAYEAVYRLEGVEQATASFREGRVTALIDPAKTDREKLVAALKKRQVTVKDRQ